MTVKQRSGKKVSKLIDIWGLYKKGYMIPDLISIVVLVVNILTNESWVNYLKILILIKVFHHLDKL